MPVQSGQNLIQSMRLQPYVDGIRDRMGFHRDMFEQACLPVVELAAEWVQLLPASESHHHAQPGGLLTHMMETATHALRFRQGYLLPVGAPPEEIPARKHRWTYAVFLAALLHDIGRPIADINVVVYRSGKACGKWHPLAGSMPEQGITEYSLNFEVRRDYELHRKLPIVLFQRLVPPNILAWLAEDAALMAELTTYLSGEKTPGALLEIAVKADSESVRANLMHGPRTRFASAKTVPLIERLMQALRLMLEEGRLSLNRAGSHGWIHDGKAWFVSKRLADEVRQFLTDRESGEGIPSKDKNDRLFDTWQEYGALIPTEDNRAVWQVAVSLDDGWKQTFTVLCFPLERLFSHPGLYPEPVRGTVASVAPGEVESGVPEGEPESPDAPDQAEPGSSYREDNLELALSADDGFPVQAQVNSPGAPAAPKREPSFALPALRAPDTAKTVPAAVRRTAPENPAESFLNDEDTAIAKPRARTAATLKPVAPAGQMAAPAASSSKKPPTDAALRFMRWIQEGLAEGSMAYNRADAMIHFVPEGMMLVSPLIFRRFADLFGEDGAGAPSDRPALKQGTGIQRQVTNAGWHLVTGEKKNNIQRYTVIGADGQGRKLISGVVIVDPSRFVNPLPENNPCIVRFEQQLEHS